MVQLTLRITAAAGQAHRLVQALQAVARHARRQDGCAKPRIAADVDEADTFWYSEQWLERESLERRLRADAFAQVLALMETSVCAPLLEIRDMSASDGLEYVARLRDAAMDGAAPERS